MKTIPLFDTSTFETHLDGLLGMYMMMAVAQREEACDMAWKNVVELVNTRDDLDDDAKLELLMGAAKRLEEDADGFVKRHFVKRHK